MKRLMKSAALAVSVSLFASSAFAESVRLTGSGASFPAPIYLTWFKDFSKNTAGCLLYTSDAADDTPCVDLGGRLADAEPCLLYTSPSPRD